MSREILVLGAGMVGVSIAWHLLNRGHQVTLVDRRDPGHETSFGNAGIIQREAVRPYPFPRDLATILRVLPNHQIDIRYRPASVLNAALSLFSYWRNSAPKRYEHIVPEYAALIRRALEPHATMIEAANAGDLIRQDGYISVFRTQEALDMECRRAQDSAERFGVTYRILDSEALSRLEPNVAAGMAGAIHWTQPWTAADPGALVAAYARAFEAQGGQFVRASVQALSRQGDRWQAITETETLSGAQVVLAMGPWSPRLLSEQGLRVPLFTKRGYHMHYGMDAEAALQHWVMDAEVGYLLCPMRAGIRLTTGAELAKPETPRHYHQLEAAEAAARRFFPLGERLDAEPWMGSRPCTPDMKPIIGPAPGLSGLWLAFGHGHQGFTLGPVTGQLIGQMMDGETPDIDMAPYRADRFQGSARS